MKRTVAVLLSMLLMVSVIFPFHIISVGNGSFDDREFVIKSSVKFTAVGQEWNLTEEEKAISLYMNSSWQTVNLINNSRPFESVKTDEDGNAIAVLNMSKIEAGESAEYTVFYQIVSKPRSLPDIDENTAWSLSDIPHDLTDPYLSNSGTWMTNNTELRYLARFLAGNETNVLVILENFVNWIWDKRNINYTTHEVPLYPSETLSSKQGDCDDQAILLISLCRIIRIPAYLQIGCIYMPQVKNESSTVWSGHVENVQNRIGWHGWAMVYVPPWGWLPVDLTYSSRGSPLDAIESAAVTSQDVIQYMNIITTDYVTEARRYKNFLENHPFHIWAYDDMIPGRGTDPFGFIFESSMKYVLAALLLAGVVANSLVVLLHIKHVRKRQIEQL